MKDRSPEPPDVNEYCKCSLCEDEVHMDDTREFQWKQICIWCINKIQKEL